MKKHALFCIPVLVTLLAILSACNQLPGKKINVMVVAGGHNFDTTEFVEMFRSLDGIRFEIDHIPEAPAGPGGEAVFGMPLVGVVGIEIMDPDEHRAFVDIILFDPI